MLNKKTLIIIFTVLILSLITAWWFGYYYKNKSNIWWKNNISMKYDINIKNVDKKLSEKDKNKYLERIKKAQTQTNWWNKLQIMEAYNEIGYCYQQMWEYNNAINNYIKTLELGYDDVALNNTAIIFSDNWDYIKSNKFYWELMKKYPDSAEFLEKIISNYLKAWDKTTALRTLDNFAANYWSKEEYKQFILSTRQSIEQYK